MKSIGSSNPEIDYMFVLLMKRLEMESPEEEPVRKTRIDSVPAKSRLSGFIIKRPAQVLTCQFQRASQDKFYNAEILSKVKSFLQVNKNADL